MIDVLLVDDYPVMRQLLREVLEAYTDITIVGEAGTGEDAVIQATRLQPAVVIIDIHLPTMNGIEATRLIKRQCSCTAVIGLTDGEPDHTEHAMLSAGATAVVSKGQIFTALHSAIVEVVSRLKSPV